MNTRQLIFSLVGICAIVFVFFVVERAGRATPASTRTAPTSQQASDIKRWRERIAKVGGAKAYEELAAYVASSSPQARHAEAHSFGDALYLEKGAEALSVCDDRFSFGCFHEFLGRAIATLGLSAVSDLDEGCFSALTKSPLSCQHGTGHGVMAYLGYSDGDLFRALEVCKGLKHNNPIGGCYGGVFMEYNLQTMLGTEAKIRKATNDLQNPCDLVDGVYKEACYYWQPQWWRQMLSMKGVADPVAAYTQIGALCAQAPRQYARSCYEGTGNNLPPDVDFDADRARVVCEHVSLDPKYQLYCKSVAANSLFTGGAGKKGDSLAVCKGLSGDELHFCTAYSKNEANAVNQRPDPL